MTLSTGSLASFQTGVDLSEGEVFKATRSLNNHATSQSLRLRVSCTYIMCTWQELKFGSNRLSSIFLPTDLSSISPPGVFLLLNIFTFRSVFGKQVAGMLLVTLHSPWEEIVSENFTKGLASSIQANEIKAPHWSTDSYVIRASSLWSSLALLTLSTSWNILPTDKNIHLPLDMFELGWRWLRLSE